MDVTFFGYFHIAVTLLFSAIVLGLAISLAVRPTDKKLKILGPMSWATLFFIMASIAGGFGATALRVSLTHGGGQTDVVNQVMRGLAEAMVPAVFGLLCWRSAGCRCRQDCA